MKNTFASSHPFGANPFSFVSRHKGTSLTLAGAFAAAGIITTVGVQAQSSGTPTPAASTHFNASVEHTVSSSSDSPTTPDTSTTNSSVHTELNTTTTGASHNVQLNVNGQDIPVPANGTTQQTVTSNDGGQTSVTTNSTTNVGNGSATNSSSSSFTLNVTNDSTASGGSTTQ